MAVPTPPERIEPAIETPHQEIETPESVILTELSKGHPLMLCEILDALKAHQLGLGYIALINIMDELVDRGRVIRDWNSDGVRIYFPANK